MNVTKEEIEQALKEFPESIAVLKSLFPEYFEERNLINLAPGPGSIYHNDNYNTVVHIFREASSKYAGKSLFLSSNFNWKIIKEDDTLLLVPTKKE